MQEELTLGGLGGNFGCRSGENGPPWQSDDADLPLDFDVQRYAAILLITKH